MLRTLIAGAGVGALLCVGLATVPIAADAVEPEGYGRTSAQTQVLKPRCDHYYYRYEITAPGDDWAAETFLIGPRGGKIASSAVLQGSDPRVGRDQFRACRPSLIAGRYKIRMKVTFDMGEYNVVSGFVEPSYFRLVRRR